MVTITLSVNGNSSHVSFDFLEYFRMKDLTTTGGILSAQEVLLLLDELAKFLYISADAEDPVSPTKELDELWHELILWDLEAYLQFCKDLTGGGKIVYHKRTDTPYPRENLERAAIACNIKLSPKVWGTRHEGSDIDAYDETVRTKRGGIVGGSCLEMNDDGSTTKQQLPTAGKTVMYAGGDSGYDADCA